MYPVKLGFPDVLARIRTLSKKHPAEALVTSMFTFEKLVKRSVRRAIVARGFTVEQAEILLERAQFEDLKRMWEVFERQHKRLPEILGANWQNIPEAKKMRNDLVHGNAVYDLEACRDFTKEVLGGLVKLQKYGLKEFGFDPWTKRPRKKTALPWAP